MLDRLIKSCFLLSKLEMTLTTLIALCVFLNAVVRADVASASITASVAMNVASANNTFALALVFAMFLVFCLMLLVLIGGFFFVSFRNSSGSNNCVTNNAEWFFHVAKWFSSNTSLSKKKWKKSKSELLEVRPLEIKLDEVTNRYFKLDIY